MRPEQSLGYINRMVDQQAFMLSANDVFAASAVLFLLLIPIVWWARTSAWRRGRRWRRPLSGGAGTRP
ncbi:hypothetical protein [uncultured Propionivibrio sp.]|uniref:hypothetical protein n=1 Tax=uncultured Propionivibrio sp. TaxID=426737 RepID=UPI0029BFF916|nr:hypothetical protein [uncultured Propionivibrio sp.]